MRSEAMTDTPDDYEWARQHVREDRRRTGRYHLWMGGVHFVGKSVDDCIRMCREWYARKEADDGG
jgi:hypothetical protein